MSGVDGEAGSAEGTGGGRPLVAVDPAYLVDGGTTEGWRADLSALAATGAELLVVDRRGGKTLLRPVGELEPAGLGPIPPETEIQGHDLLRALLDAGVKGGAPAIALVASASSARDAGWLERLLSPVMEGGFDLAFAAYHRHPLDGALLTGVASPLTRAAFGIRLRDPLASEFAIGAALAGRILADRDWKRDPTAAGTPAWLLGRTVGAADRVCEVWLGARARPAHEAREPGPALERVAGQIFREMKRRVDRWQRISGSQAPPAFGPAPADPPARPVPELERLAEGFRLGVRELSHLWSTLLPPATLVALRRAAAQPGGVKLEDRLWARIVFDFAVAHSIGLLAPRPLLHAMAPLYLGWVSSFGAEMGELDWEGCGRRADALGSAFESEKGYLISRWRWPEEFGS